MDRLELLAYVCLGGVAVVWLVVLVTGLVAAFPYGLIGLVGLVGFGLLLVKVLRDRLASREDDHYARNVRR